MLITRRDVTTWLAALPVSQALPESERVRTAVVVLDLVAAEETFVIRGLVNGRSFVFLVDTGASISSVFEENIPKIGPGVEIVPERNVIVRGLAETARRPVVTLDEITLGAASHRRIEAVVLPRQRLGYEIDGVLGMDVLRYYAMLFDPVEQRITLIPSEEARFTSLRGWDEVRLHPNPFGGPDYGLHFGDAQINRQEVPVLIDTGTAPSLMNWEAAAFNRTLRRFREAERRKWEIQGATGSFSPVVMAEMPTIELGEHRWDYANLLVADFEPIDVLGFSGRPLIICGADMLSQRRFLIDFERDWLYFDPSVRPHERTPVPVRRGAAADDPY